MSARFEGTLGPSNGVAPTRLWSHAHAQGGGQPAQAGFRLVDAAAAKMAEEFFAAFEARLAPSVAAGTGRVPKPAGTERGKRALCWGVALRVLPWLWYRFGR